jgi:hypothetical protein
MRREKEERNQSRGSAVKNSEGKKKKGEQETKRQRKEQLLRFLDKKAIK